MPSMFSYGAGTSKASRSSGATITSPTNLSAPSVDAHLAAESERARSQRNLDARYQTAYDDGQRSGAPSTISLLRTSSSASSVAPSFVSYASSATSTLPTIDDRPHYGPQHSWYGPGGSNVGTDDGDDDGEHKFDESRWPRADPYNDRFELLRPREGAEAIIDEMFADMLRRRELGCASARNCTFWAKLTSFRLVALPASKQQEMANFPREKKWQMIYQDRLASWQAARSRLGGTASDKRSTVANSVAFPGGMSPYSSASADALGTGGSNVGSAAANVYHKVAGKSRLGVGGSHRGKKEQPEWYIKKFMDRSADHKVVAALGVALRTYEIECVNASCNALSPAQTAHPLLLAQLAAQLHQSQRTDRANQLT